MIIYISLNSKEFKKKLLLLCIDPYWASGIQKTKALEVVQKESPYVQKKLFTLAMYNLVDFSSTKIFS